MSPEVTLTRYRSVEAVPADAWDAVASGYSYYASHAWLRAVASMPGAADATYFVASAGDTPVGAFAAYLVTDELSKSYHPAQAICGQDGAREPVFPAILLGGRAAYTSQLMLDPRLLADDAFRDRLLMAIEELRQERRARSVWLLYGDEASAAAAQRLIGGCRFEIQPTTVIDLPGRSFEAWLAGFRSHRRQRILGEVRAFADAGYDVEVSPLTPGDAPPFGELLAALLAKYRGAASAAAMANYVRLQVDACAESSTAFRCYVGGELVGFSYGFEWNGCMHMRACGFDYDRLKGAYEYFNLVYYRPIREAYAKGLRRVELGPGSFDAKQLRGGAFERRYAVGAGFEPPESWAARNRELLASVYGEEHVIGGC